MTNLTHDIKRLVEHQKGFRILISNLLSLGFFAIAVYRFFSFFEKRGIPTLPIRFPVEKIVEIMCGISIPASAKIGPGLRIHHFGGIVIHNSVRIGTNATIYHNVTIGLKNDHESQAATIGDNVYIGTGTVILGNITIGNNVRIGANALVLENIPDNSTAVGNPARILVRKS